MQNIIQSYLTVLQM